MLDIIFPRDAEERALDQLTPEYFQRLVSLSEPDVDVRAILPYSNRVVRISIHALKYKGRTEIGNIFGQLLHTTLLEDVADMISFHNGNIVIVPIPLSKARMQARGYNQAEKIARAFASGDNFPPVVLVLSRVKDTPSQTTREGKHARIENLKDAFAVSNPELVRGKGIILIDDVITTGATMHEARKAFLAAGATRVYGIAVAH